MRTRWSVRGSQSASEHAKPYVLLEPYCLAHDREPVRERLLASGRGLSDLGLDSDDDWGDELATAEFLTDERGAILDAAEGALARMHARHYESAGANEVRQRLEALFDHLLDALRSRDLGPIVAYAEQVAQERFNAGYDLTEVQTAFNVLEEATWSRVFAELQPTEFAEALGLVSTILGAAKDALARNYVSLATHTRAPSLDLQALFAGTEGRTPVSDG